MTDVVVETEKERVERWRLERFMELGLSYPQALFLAKKSQVDLHRFADLIEAGCAPELAARIVWP